MILDFLFPRGCVVCGFLGSYLCLSCQKKLVSLQYDRCLYCNGRSFLGLTHPVCKKEQGVDGCLSIFLYNYVFKAIVTSLKYRLVTDIARELPFIIPLAFQYKLRYFQKYDNNLFLQSIPLHPKRLKERGFNQADKIRDWFATLIPNGVTSNVLERIHHTVSQAQLQKKLQKYQNIRGAFALSLRSPVQGENFILFDDVLTTGSTIKEAGRILKKNGATKVFVITLAKG